MQKVSPSLWSRVPGYDSDGEEDDNGDRHSDNEDSSEESDGEFDHQKSSTKERLQQVYKVLGEKWIHAPCIEFSPANFQAGKLVPRMSAAALAGFGPKLPAFRIDRIHAPLVRDLLLGNGFRPTTYEDWLITWSGHRMRDGIHKSMHEFQRVNHFPGSTELTRKDKLWENFRRMQNEMGDDFDFVPETFVLPGEAKRFKQRFHKTKGHHLWIVKPAASSQGKGIFILRHLSDLPQNGAAVVSRYIENPLLIQGLKFDLRIYVLVTSFDPLRAFIYREGLTRFASKPYSTLDEHLSDVFRHLTNYSINKSAENFLENQRVQADNYGHKWSLSALNRHLKCVGIDVDVMWSGIMDLIVKTLLTVEPIISHSTREACIHEQSCFELYGFDVLVDENLKPWLLEVNLSPSMQADSPLDKQIKSSLICDAFNLVGIRHIDQQAVSNARLRSRLIYLNKLQTGVAAIKQYRTTNSTFGAEMWKDPLRRSAEELAARGTTAALVASSVPPPGEASTASTVSTSASPSPAEVGSDAPSCEESKDQDIDCRASDTQQEESEIKDAEEKLPEKENAELEDVAQPPDNSQLPEPPSTVPVRRAPLMRKSTVEGAAASRPPQVFDRKTPVVLDSLGDAQLKLLAHSLEEFERCTNFIRLYPTPGTTKRYEPVTKRRGNTSLERASLLSAALFGKTPVISTEPRPLPVQADNEGGDASQAEEFEREEEKPVAEDRRSSRKQREVELQTSVKMSRLGDQTMQTLKVFGSRTGSQLVLMEYLLRILNTCRRLSNGARKRIEANEEAGAAAIIQSFHRHIAHFINLAAVDEDQTLDAVDKLSLISRKALFKVLIDTWSLKEEPAALSANRPKELSLTDIAPTAFAESAIGCRAIDTLEGVSASDLESILRSSFCPASMRNLLELPDFSQDPLRFGDEFVSQRRRQCAGQVIGPLSEIEFLLKVQVSKTSGIEALMRSDSDSKLPRLVRPGFSYSAQLPALVRSREQSPIEGSSPMNLTRGGIAAAYPPTLRRSASSGALLGLAGTTSLKLMKATPVYQPAHIEIEL